jgi:hypothetical protein
MNAEIKKTAAADSSLTEEEKARFAAIINYWHKLEFFMPFDLTRNIVDEAEDQDWKLRWLHHSDLARLSARELWWAELPADHQLVGFNLYLVVFDKAEVTEICEAVLGPPADELAHYEQQEHGDLEGDTCFAKVKLNVAGELHVESFAVSTLPWAAGQIRDGGVAALHSTAFAEAETRLSELLMNFRASRQIPTDADEGTERRGLTGRDVLRLYDLLVDWAGFKPSRDKPIALLEVVASEKRQKPEPQIKPQGDPTAAGSTEAAGGANQEEVQSEEDEPDEEEFEINILNSFYIRDLERALRSITAGEISIPLKEILSPLPEGERIDLDSPTGRHHVFETLKPNHLNRGHWFDNPTDKMSLLQQFAINTATRRLATGGLFSVNGPPGTGKTTLLRDIIAENIVRRARLLADLDTAAQAFTGSVDVDFGDRGKAHIRLLRADIAGFGMIIASTNNGAVENVSLELPKTSAIGDHWLEGPATGKPCYLQSVAFKIAAQNRKGGFDRLDAKDVPWGLMSCALGNAKNRDRFVQRWYWPTDDEKEGRIWPGPIKPKTIRQWVADYDGPNFQQAADRFASCDQQISAHVDELARYVELIEAIEWTSEAQYAEGEIRAEREAESAVRAMWEALREAEAARLQFADRLSELQEEERLIDRTEPPRDSAVFAEHRDKHFQWKSENARAQLEARRATNDCDKRLAAELRPGCESAAQRHKEAILALECRRSKHAALKAELAGLKEAFPGLPVPASYDELGADRWQIDGLWHTAELARLRSELFQAAVQLHEAWLAEAARKTGDGGSGFAGNLLAIVLMLSKRRPLDETYVRHIWQSLFMVVPVVSSTFASFANQFRGLVAHDIDWLFIDEAGQAVPQAAVGALWRAKRAVVVGDPLQIPPVFTLPLKLIAAFSACDAVTADGHFAPNRASVQTLADAANPFGTYKEAADDTKRLWIGSPLRVHRRCLDPMFAVANAIAYDDKMVFGLKSRTRPDGPPVQLPSRWIDIGGKTDVRQRVPQQIDFVLKVVRTICAQEETLPSLCIISPFKFVKASLITELQRDLSANEAAWATRRAMSFGKRRPRTEIRKWIRNSIGTVHTFQGKQADIVLMVLGADKEHAGAAQWASSTPNLLNVALTRARHRFFMVGDYGLWSGMRFFKRAASELEPLSQDQFMSALLRAE